MDFSEAVVKIPYFAIKDKLFGTNELISKEEALKISSRFNKKEATFVTINKERKLRGCIGSLVAYEDLYDNLVKNSISAAFHDPRFPPLTKEEFKNIEIETSILTEPIRVEYNSIEELKSKITKEDGIILQLNNYQATFLPQVWEELSEFKLFFAHLCVKAGLPVDCLKYKPNIFKYNVEKYYLKA